MAANRPPRDPEDSNRHPHRRREDRWDGRNVAPVAVRRELARIAASRPHAFLRRAR